MKRWPNRLFLDRLALPHMSTNFWMCFCGILFNFQGLRRTFPKSVLELKTTVDHQIWGNTPIGRHKTDGPIRLYSSFLQKSLSSCRCFDRHQVGFTNCIQLNEIFDIVSRIYSLQIGHQCYLQSAPSVGINLNHDLEEGSYWSINFVLTNKSCWREKLLASKVVGAKSCWDGQKCW